MNDTIYTVREVAEYLKISKSRVYYLIRRGELPHLKVGKKVRVRESDLNEWMRQIFIRSLNRDTAALQAGMEMARDAFRKMGFG